MFPYSFLSGADPESEPEVKYFLTTSRWRGRNCRFHASPPTSSVTSRSAERVSGASGSDCGAISCVLINSPSGSGSPWGISTSRNLNPCWSDSSPQLISASPRPLPMPPEPGRLPEPLHVTPSSPSHVPPGLPQFGHPSHCLIFLISLSMKSARSPSDVCKSFRSSGSFMLLPSPFPLWFPLASF